MSQFENDGYERDGDDKPPPTRPKSHHSAKSTRSRRSQRPAPAECEPPAAAPAIAPAEQAPRPSATTSTRNACTVRSDSFLDLSICSFSRHMCPNLFYWFPLCSVCSLPIADDEEVAEGDMSVSRPSSAAPIVAPEAGEREEPRPGFGNVCLRALHCTYCTTRTRTTLLLAQT